MAPAADSRAGSWSRPAQRARRARHHDRDVRLPLHARRDAASPTRRRCSRRRGGRRSTRRGRIASFAALPLFIGGKSMGGRIASHVASQGVDDMRGLIFLGYPLHPPGRPDQRRDAHLPGITEPMLFVQGTRDQFGTADEIRALLPRLNPRARAVRGGGRRPLVQGPREDRRPQAAGRASTRSSTTVGAFHHGRLSSRSGAALAP